MKYALIDSNNIVQNVIVYDGVAEYAPAAGLALQQVNDWVNIGDNKNISEPTPPESAP